jgi:hypothetical protein
MRSPSPDQPARVIEDALQSIFEEPSPSESVVDDEKDGDELDIQGLQMIVQQGYCREIHALAITKEGIKEEAKVRDWSTFRNSCGVVVHGIPNNRTLVRVQTLAILSKRSTHVGK